MITTMMMIDDNRIGSGKQVGQYLSLEFSFDRLFEKNPRERKQPGRICGW
jgi:hypothetical protein